MICAVIDTNVLVSALLKKKSIPSLVVENALVGTFEYLISEELLIEYREVLLRPKFGFPLALVDDFIMYFLESAEIMSSIPQDLKSSDPKDQKILDLAASQDAYLVTGNLKHFEAYDKAISPSDFYALIMLQE